MRPLDTGDRRTFAQPRELDVLVPTRDRPAELSATLAGLAAQEIDFGVVLADQSAGTPVWHWDAVAGMVRVLRHRGHPVLLRRNLPRRGLAQQRAYLLARSRARLVLFLDDDVWLEPGTVDRLVTALRTLRCGLVGNFPHGLSYTDDHRLGQERGAYEEWTGPVRPERVVPRGPLWHRAQVHTAANLLHVQQRRGLPSGRWEPYKIAWLGACVLYERAKLVACGGFDFWREVPPAHSGEDVLAQIRVLDRFGGAGVLPSGAYHLETPTTLPRRDVECFDLVPPFPGPPRTREQA